MSDQTGIFLASTTSGRLRSRCPVSTTSGCPRKRYLAFAWHDLFPVSEAVHSVSPMTPPHCQHRMRARWLVE